MKTNGTISRCIVYPQDVMIVMGISERSARKLMNKIKLSYKKKSHQVLTFEEFSEYTGIPVEKIFSVLG